MQRLKLAVTSGAVLAALAFAAAVSLAESPPPSAKPPYPPEGPESQAAKQPEVKGTVLNLANGRIVLTTKSGTSATILTTATTTYEAKKRASATAADVKVGARIEAKGTANTDGTFTAAKIKLEGADKPEGAKQPKFDGTVAAVNGSKVTITRKNGTSATVVLGTTTTFRGEGASAAAADIKVRVRIEAKGSLNADGSLAAANVSVKAPKAQ